MTAPISEIVGVRGIRFEDTGIERLVTGDCKVCMRAREVYGEGVVAPSGIAHIVPSYGDRTLCGKDATAIGWWWAL